MSCLFRILKIDLCYMFRKKMMLFLWLIPCAYLSYGFINFCVRDKQSIFAILQGSGYIIVALIFLGMITGVNMAVREDRYRCIEIVRSSKKSYVSYLSKLTALIVFGVFPIGILMMEYIAFHLLLGYGFFQLFETILYLAVIWGMTIVGSMVIGYVLGIWGGSKKGYILSFFLAVFLSPIGESFSFIPRFLNMGEEGNEIMYNDFIGMYVDRIIVYRHIFLVVSAVFFIALTFVLKYRRVVGTKIKAAVLPILMISFLAASVFAYSGSGKIRYFEYDKYYGYNSDFEYYSRSSNSGVFENKEDGNVKVDKYVIDLKVLKNKVEYKADIYLNSIPNRLKKLKFTLYHNLKVKRIYNKNNIEYIWQQSGDYITVENPENIISMEISGYPGINSFINENAFCLMPNFPWYPVPGTFIVAGINIRNELVPNSILLPQKTQFVLNVNKKIYTNLPSVGENSYSGAACGVAVLKGALRKTQLDGIEIAAPPYMFDSIKGYLDKFFNVIEKINKNLKISYNADISKVFVVPFSYAEDYNYSVEICEDEMYINSIKLYSYMQTGVLNDLQIFYPVYIKSAYIKDFNYAQAMDELYKFIFYDDKYSFLKEYADSKFTYKNDKTGAVKKGIIKMVKFYEKNGKEALLEVFLNAYRREKTFDGILKILEQKEGN